MAFEAYTLEAAEDDIAQLRGELSQKEENLTITGQLNATGATAGSPTLITTDTWHDTGALTASWGKGSGYFKYQLLASGWVAVAVQALTIGTVADSTTILAAANGLPAGYRPVTPKQVLVSTDDLKVSPVAGTSFEPAWLEFQTGGSVQCFGIGTAATFVNCFAAFPIDI